MTLRFDNTFVRDLPADSVTHNRRRQVHEACFSRVEPTPVSAPDLVAWSKEACDLLGLSEAAIRSEPWVEALGGSRLLPGMEPYAACYGGHQFGNWAGQLGDGRAITLGEVVHDSQRWELQLKGAGPTPYSRMGDGRAVMRSSVREFLCSEAMHHLGVPTTRALSLVSTGEPVVRDMLYDGNPRPEPGAVVCRVAPSFIRFGNFEIFSARDDVETLRTLTDYTLRRDFPELGTPSKATYVALLAEVARRTAVMVAHWMRVGFVHGVMNTDNMSVLGLTIDYGPYGWLDDYDPNWTPNTTDAQGRRYRYAHQPNVALWNLIRFANALYPLVEESQPLEEACRVFPETFEREHQRMLAAKLGLAELVVGDDDPLVEGLFELLQLVETDMTIFFRRLADVDLEAPSIEPLRDAYYTPPDEPQQEHIERWLTRYAERARADGADPGERRASMNRTNPKYVLRNYIAQLAIDEAEKGDASEVSSILDVMRRPYDEQPGNERYAEKRPDWARDRPGCSMLSCSS